mmetsp:Transcript_5559/g.6780  ORF Transcript_5559/g.6780 Transcript_5559/m.6780 type:complete len:845 (-) Transcript_5559:1289-3823(-)
MPLSNSALKATLLAAALTGFASCANVLATTETAPASVPTQAPASNADMWPVLNPPALDPDVERRVDLILSQMTLEQKIGQTIQADTDSVTPEEVLAYRLGSVLSGGNSAPGDEDYADTSAWLEAADAYFEASVNSDGVEIAIPVIWGIDAVHGHANLTGATVFPHNIGLGAAGNPDLIEEIMEITAAELIVSGHDWTFAPTLATPRDDRWGRTYEGFSEDPEIVAAYADRIVYGLQGRPGEDSFFDDTRVISSAKHFVGDGGTTRGVDQGDTAVSEAELRDIHAAGYYPAIEAGVQTVMASFNSWNGTKMHGYSYMLTDVLKERMGFNGFVIGDWNGHGQIPGCTNTDCPESFLAGVDMYMAPDSWKGVYESMLEAVISGEVSEARLDDSVRRILRTKVIAGVFEKPKPSARNGAGDVALLGSDHHREVARRAVRESLVLIKNNQGTLPLAPNQTILVVGEGANSMTKQAGGWTLSWQGGGYDNSEFPNGESLLEGIVDIVGGAGGRVIFDPAGTSNADADIVIAVYGEDPYAEFQGDRDHLDFQSPDFDTKILADMKAAGKTVVSVFLSGRPLWTNPEINNSDAFVAAWLPGTEGGGVADVLFQAQPDYDFTGRLSFSWPATAVDFDNNLGGENYAPLFPLGYGLSYSAAAEDMPQLSEESGIAETLLVERGAVFRRGGTLAPWKAYLVSQSEGVLFNGTGANLDGVTASRLDHLAQEDAIALTFSADNVALAFLPEGQTVDWSTELSEGKALSFAFRSDQQTPLTVSMGCTDGLVCEQSLEVQLAAGDWREVNVPLACFAEAVDLSKIDTWIGFSSDAGASFGLADIRTTSTSTNSESCAAN